MVFAGAMLVSKLIIIKQNETYWAMLLLGYAPLMVIKSSLMVLSRMKITGIMTVLISMFSYATVLVKPGLDKVT